MSAEPGKGAERLHHWDFSRAFYLMLGIPFHAAVVYSLSHEWSISSPDKSQVLTWLANFIHMFRMPGFFILAGLFSMMLLDRRGAGRWLKSRLFRLGLPLLSATLLILPFQIVVQSLAQNLLGVVPTADLPAYMIGQLTSFGEPWISHLWFLWSLIAYCVALAFVYALVGGFRWQRALQASACWCGANRLAALMLFVAACAVGAYLQTKIVAASPYYGNAVINYNQYVIYFGFGVLIYKSRRTHDWFLRQGPLSLFVGAGLVTLAQMPGTDMTTHTFKVMAGIAGALFIVGAISRMAFDRCASQSPRVRKLVDASFTIYLFHHPVVYVLATLLLLIDLPPVIEFALIATGAAFISYGIHLVISRSPLAMLMFNGIKPAPGRVTAATGQAAAQGVSGLYPLRQSSMG
ncbi:acyltransferase family protein [Hoeflea sp. G2-23]|uniref:Acyltransferase family protein n=1 Tax=Hoeflea algicola TaxID=2983763 RepID=A0ABT3Z3E6_9HYPH|nr:acyltransferase family protein [Hoeflea algicola]MCY0146293.1 acyltransferase family protein [Hoeflea algicola]